MFVDKDLELKGPEECLPKTEHSGKRPGSIVSVCGLAHSSKQAALVTTTF